MVPSNVAGIDCDVDLYAAKRCLGLIRLFLNESISDTPIRWMLEITGS